MSVWATTDVLAGKSYVHSGHDPRKIAPLVDVDLAMVPDYVYKDGGDGDRVLPYVRLSVCTEDVVLTEKQASDLAAALMAFVERPKWRGKPRSESVSSLADKGGE